jgi:hypothetical protein
MVGVNRSIGTAAGIDAKRARPASTLAAATAPSPRTSLSPICVATKLVPAKVVSEAALPWVTSAPRSTPLSVRLSLSRPLISEVAAPTTATLTIRPVLIKTVAAAAVVVVKPMEVATAGPKVPADTQATAAMMTN